MVYALSIADSYKANLETLGFPRTGVPPHNRSLSDISPHAPCRCDRRGVAVAPILIREFVQVPPAVYPVGISDRLLCPQQRGIRQQTEMRVGPNIGIVS